MLSLNTGATQCAIGPFLSIVIVFFTCQEFLMEVNIIICLHIYCFNCFLNKNNNFIDTFNWTKFT